MKTFAPPHSSIQWQPAERLGQLSMGSRLRPWLTGERLLTERMRALCGARYALQVIGHWSGAICAEQRAAMRIGDLTGLIRDVELRCGAKVWVFGCSIVPDSTLEAHAWLAELGDSALCETLRGLAGFERTPYEYAWLPASDALCARALRHADLRPAGLWARRARFALRQAPLLSLELFLPALGQT